MGARGPLELDQLERSNSIELAAHIIAALTTTIEILRGHQPAIGATMLHTEDLGVDRAIGNEPLALGAQDEHQQKEREELELTLKCLLIRGLI
ncbi:hypothetical protein NDI52_30400 [Leptolyngbya sp. PL-A3]